MGWIESILIGGGEFVRWALSGLLAALGWFFGLLDGLLNPILSPVLGILNRICTPLGDATYFVLGFLPGWLGLTLLSAALGLVMLIALRYTSNQAQIARAKDAIKANLLALKLYKDDLGVTFRTQARLFLAVARLQRYILTPVLIMTLPMLLLFAQMAARHQWRPLQPGEATILRVRLKQGQNVDLRSIQLKTGSGVSAEVGPLPGRDDLVWRIRGTAPGRHVMWIRAAGIEVEKDVVVGEPLSRVSPLRPGASWTSQLLYPVESHTAFFDSIEVEYPPLAHWFYGSDWWVLSLLVISMLTAFLFRSAFGVVF